MSEITVFGIIYKADKFIEQYVNNMIDVNKFNKNYIIIINFPDSHGNPQLIEQCLSLLSKNCYPEVKITTMDIKNDPGLYGCWNIAIKQATTKYICNHNIDDIIDPEYFKKCMEKFIDPEIGLVSTPLYTTTNIKMDFDKKTIEGYKKLWDVKSIVHTIPYNELSDSYEKKHEVFKMLRNGPLPNIGKKWIKFSKYDIFDMFRYDTPYPYDVISIHGFSPPGCCPVWRRELFIKYGEFLEHEYGMPSDWEYWLRLMTNKIKFAILESPYAVYYLSQSSMGHRNETHNKECIKKIVRKYHPMFHNDNNIYVLPNESEKKIDQIVAYITNDEPKSVMLSTNELRNYISELWQNKHNIIVLNNVDLETVKNSQHDFRVFSKNNDYVKFNLAYYGEPFNDMITKNNDINEIIRLLYAKHNEYHKIGIQCAN